MSVQPKRQVRAALRVLHLVGRWAPVVVWASLIYVVSDQPRLPHASLPLLDVLLKKGAHLTEYAILAGLVYQALGSHLSATPRRRVTVAWAVAVLYAVSDELHQAQVPGRTAAAVDVAIDGVGALLGLLGRRLLARGWPAPPPTRRKPPCRASPPAEGQRPNRPLRTWRGSPLAAADVDRRLLRPLYPLASEGTAPGARGSSPTPHGRGFSPTYQAIEWVRQALETAGAKL